MDPELVVATVKKINKILEELTDYGRPSDVFANIASICTFYLANPLLPHGSKQCLDKLTAFIDKQNREVFNPAGLHLINPVSQALLQLEFHVIQRTK